MTFVTLTFSIRSFKVKISKTV